MVAKDPRSTYRQGSTKSKIKVRHEAVSLVGGIREVDAFDGVLVGEQVGDRLVYRGVVEWGFNAHEIISLSREAKMFARRTSPFVDLPRMGGAVRGRARRSRPDVR